MSCRTSRYGIFYVAPWKKGLYQGVRLHEQPRTVQELNAPIPIDMPERVMQNVKKVLVKFSL